MKHIIDNWTVQGYYPNVPMFGFSETDGITQFSATQVYEVEGGDSIYDTLYKNNLIENPMIDANSYKCEWVANRWWVYRTQVEITGKNPRLLFEGVDGNFSVYFNNKFLARHDNSYVPLTIDMSAYSNESGTLMVMVENQECNLNQSGYTSKIVTQRPRYDSKWDFCPRMVSMGLVAPVYLVNDASIEEVAIKAGVDGEVSLKYLSAYGDENTIVRFELDGHTVESSSLCGELTIKVENPKLWYPNGMGSAHLYEGKLSLVQNGETVWFNSYNIGFRTVEYVKNEDAPLNSLPYTLVVNGEKVYIKGVNIVPFDMSRAKITKERYQKYISLAKQMNVNLIRVWGGGIIETEDFYNTCDQNGIMVWQDFMQSSSGIDNCATVLAEGLARIEETAKSAVKRIRNHPSLVLYCGGNELMDNWLPHDYTHPNIAMLKEIVDRLDGTRMMLPATASGPKAGGNKDLVGKGLHHDIHGPWTYDGNEIHNSFYNCMDSLLHSEFGVDGFCNIETISEIFSEEQRKFSSISENYVWRHKAEWWDQMPMTEKMFGKIDNIEDQVAFSQYLQAEGLRYAIEANRRRAFNNSGCIIWQFNEPYPNLCCTNLVDYFEKPKTAYFAVKQAYEAFNPNMKYEKTVYQAGEEFFAELYLTADKSGEYVYEVECITEDGVTKLNYNVKVESNGKSVKVGEIAFKVPQKGSMWFNLRAKDSSGNLSQNKIMLLIGVGVDCHRADVNRYIKELRD